MAQIFNPANFNSPNTSVNIDSNNRNNPFNRQSRDFVPTRRLTDSPASNAPFGNTDNNFDALGSSIPDKFGTFEQPKLKFLFTAMFVPRSGLSLPELGAQSMDDMRFALKKASRPAPTITYQDVNFYGYRTKVAIKMDYGTVTLSFYDDVVNRAHNIISQYIKMVSPIANMAAITADNLDGSYNNARSIGSLGAGTGAAMGPFKYMRVTHHMLDDKNPNTGSPKQVFYDYLNPKIITVALDDLDMSSSEANTVDITFVYDSVNITYSDVNNIGNPTSTTSSNNPIITSPSGTGGSPLTNSAIPIGYNPQVDLNSPINGTPINPNGFA